MEVHLVLSRCQDQLFQERDLIKHGSFQPPYRDCNAEALRLLNLLEWSLFEPTNKKLALPVMILLANLYDDAQIPKNVYIPILLLFELDEWFSAVHQLQKIQKI